VAATDDNYVVTLRHEDFVRVPRGKNKCGKSRSILQVEVGRHKEEARCAADLKSRNPVKTRKNCSQEKLLGGVRLASEARGTL
jgi:hypothetical protein